LDTPDETRGRRPAPKSGPSKKPKKRKNPEPGRMLDGGLLALEAPLGYAIAGIAINSRAAAK